MRQAGRYDPDYLKIKDKYTLLEICKQPELAVEVTLMPIKKLGVDAAILYSDITNPFAGLGIDFDIVKDVGPVIYNPIRSMEDVKKLKPLQAEADLGHVLETIRILKRELSVPLIGFAGAPFTLASYLIESQKPQSNNYQKSRELMKNSPETWELLMDKLGDMVIAYLKAQIASGASAVQLFDSWAGALEPEDYRRFVLPVITRIFRELASEDAYKIYFPGVKSSKLLPLLSGIEADVIGLDHSVTVREGRGYVGGRYAVQGNMNPQILLEPMDVIKEHAKAIIDQGIEQPGYIFNLGHGLFPEASLDKVKELTVFVHDYSRSALADRAEKSGV
jgi:uroporphyrinogen decarboxylase